jgi:hypothetical protein
MFMWVVQGVGYPVPASYGLGSPQMLCASFGFICCLIELGRSRSSSFVTLQCFSIGQTEIGSLVAQTQRFNIEHYLEAL